jgi:hypothetical protein
MHTHLIKPVMESRNQKVILEVEEPPSELVEKVQQP